MRNDLSKSETALQVSTDAGFVHPVSYLRGLMSVLDQLPISAIQDVVDQLFLAYRQNRTVYVFGNGGSAALASHAACDLGKGTMALTAKSLRVISLTDNVALITAWANDVAYEDIFAAQLRSLISPGDIAFAISGSGNSPNILSGLRISKKVGGYNIGLTGFHGGKMKALCDSCIVVPSQQMQHIEDSHLCVMHSVFLALRQRVQSTEGLHEASA